MEEFIIEIANEAAAEAWHTLNKEHGQSYVDDHYEELFKIVKAEVQEAVEDAKREYISDLAYEEAFYDDYYEENSYGFRQQDMIDLHRYER